MKQLHVSDGRKRDGWFWMDNEVFDMELRPTAFVVYAFLVRIADRASEIACISVRNMARLLNMSTRTVQDALKELEEKRMIEKIARQADSGAKLANLYRLTSKDTWIPPDNGCGKNHNGCGKNYHGGVVDPTTGCGENNHGGVVKNTTPVKDESAQVVGSQRDDSRVSAPINTYIDQYSIDQENIYIKHTHINVCERERYREERFDSGIEKGIGTRNIRNGTVQLKERKEQKKTPLKGEPSAIKKSAAVGRAIEKFRGQDSGG